MNPSARIKSRYLAQLYQWLVKRTPNTRTIGGVANRGKGLGPEFIKLLMEQCKRLFNPEAIHLFVLENNRQAIACYLKCGFVFAETTDFALPYKNENFKVLKMTAYVK